MKNLPLLSLGYVNDRAWFLRKWRFNRTKIEHKHVLKECALLFVFPWLEGKNRKKFMDWVDAIRELLRAKNMSLRQLAIEFGIGNVFLSEVARGSRPASPMLKLKILTALGRNLGREELILLLPQEVADVVRKLDVKNFAAGE